MSHISKIETMIQDLGALKAACKRLCFEFVEGQKTYAWFGRWVGDTEMPEGLTVDDLGKCDHAIKVPGAQYEVGVVKVPGGYELRWDYFTSGGLMEPLGGQKAGKLMQAYSAEKLKREAPINRQRVIKEKVYANGYVELEIEGGGSW